MRNLSDVFHTSPNRGLPDENTVQKYFLEGKDVGSIELMPNDQQTLSDASIEIKDGETIMKVSCINIFD